LDYYFWEEGHVQVYKETRNGMVGPNYSSKFSPWLATGSISAKEIYWELIRFEQVILKNASTYWLYFELMWRDYFRLSALKEGACFFNMPLETTFELNSKFESWRLGETSEDFVNAHMKELLNTGFMSNRGRQNVASYLIHDLQLPWTWGAAWFESQLIDYDVCSNYGNWTYLAGVGKDPRNNRSFNIKGQAQRYDPIARFQNLWLKP
jgi:deoxyribodipyrimidine photo-lyase